MLLRVFNACYCAAKKTCWNIHHSCLSCMPTWQISLGNVQEYLYFTDRGTEKPLLWLEDFARINNQSNIQHQQHNGFTIESGSKEVKEKQKAHICCQYVKVVQNCWERGWICKLIRKWEKGVWGFGPTINSPNAFT